MAGPDKCGYNKIDTPCVQRRLALALPVLALVCLCGCGDFFSRKATELEARAILQELSQVKESPHVNNTLPAIYLAPPKILPMETGVKVFYFTKHHAVDYLGKLVIEQFSPKGADPKGKPLFSGGWMISHNPATNQLIVQCPNEDAADTVLEFLDNVDVPPVQINVDCLILERFGDETMDWETSIWIENFLGEGISLGEARANFGAFSDRGVFQPIADGPFAGLDPAFPGASLREGARSTFGLDFGYWINKGIPGHQVRTVVDMLISRGYLKILLNPTLETVNGKRATVSIRDFAPIDKIVVKAGFDEPFRMTDYEWVEDTLTVTPHVFADGSIGLTTDIKIGSKSKPEGVIQTSIITERTINIEENRIAPGQSLIIGGMRKSEKRSVVRGVPFFKDLPIIGVLFSSKDYEEKATEIIFILTPSISSGSVEHSKIVEEIRKKHASPKFETGLTDMLTDPFGSTVYTDVVEQKAIEAETERIKAEMELVDVGKELSVTQDKLSAANKKAKLERERLDKARTATAKAQAEAQVAVAEAELARKQATEALRKADVEKAKAQQAAKEAAAAKAQAEADAKAQAQVEARAAATKVRVEARKAKNPPAKPDNEAEKKDAPKPA
ncbi:MAG: hypothetical protein KAR47_05565, partial [Planctomycetes bacterium]|nr:hypothetical protein [Planctomycetota bacterium]